MKRVQKVFGAYGVLFHETIYTESESQKETRERTRREVDPKKL